MQRVCRLPAARRLVPIDAPATKVARPTFAPVKIARVFAGIKWPGHCPEDVVKQKAPSAREEANLWSIGESNS